MWVIIWIYDTSMNCFHLDCVCVFVSMDYKWSLKSLQSLESYCEQLLNGLHPFLFDCSGAHLHTHTHTHAITLCSCRSENLIWPTISRPVSLRPWGKRVGSLSHTLMHANRYWDMEENLNPGLHRCWAGFRDNRTVTETHPFWPAALSVTLPASTFNHNCPFCSIYPNCSCLKNTAQNCLVLFLNEMQKLLSSEKNTLDHWAIVQFFFSLAQVRCFWRCFWFRSGLVALFLKMSERGDSWCTDSSFSSLLVMISQVFESALLDSILKLAVISVACVHFPSQFLPSSQLAFNMLWYSTPWTATPFSNAPLWLILFVEGVSVCLLDHCQVSSVPHYCAFKEQEIPRIYTARI